MAPASSVPTFGQLTEQWLTFKRDECQNSTVGGYEDSLRKHLLPSLGARPINSLVYSELADCGDVLQSHKNSQ